MLGVASAAGRDDTTRSQGGGREMSEHTRVVCKTFERRGKSLTPESRIEMLEPSSCIDDCREETQLARGEEVGIVLDPTTGRSRGGKHSRC